MTSRSQKMRRKLMRKRISNALSVCAVIVMVVSAAYIVNAISMHMHSNQVADELRNEYYSPFTAAAENIVEPTVTLEPETNANENSMLVEEQLTPVVIDGFVPVVVPEVKAEPATAFFDQAPVGPTPEPVLQEQFVEMHDRNSDLIGWIRVNETIDYPLVWRDEDNDFYMNHDYDGKVSNSGWIFLDKRNDLYMTDDHLLIYGHNMRLGDMFGDLDLYRELAYVQEHPIIELQSAYEAEPRKYVIVSMFDASMNKSHSTYVKITRFNFDTPEEKTAYIDEMNRRSIFDLPCEVTADDQLVTLVTCSYSYPNGRFLIVARELREDETVEQIGQLFAEMN